MPGQQAGIERVRDASVFDGSVGGAETQPYSLPRPWRRLGQVPGRRTGSEGAARLLPFRRHDTSPVNACVGSINNHDRSLIEPGGTPDENLL
jgi:hypothetical protein